MTLNIFILVILHLFYWGEEHLEMFRVYFWSYTLLKVTSDVKDPIGEDFHALLLWNVFSHLKYLLFHIPFLLLML